MVHCKHGWCLKKADNTGYCKKHEKCRYNGCQLPKKNRDEQYCSSHVGNYCQVSLCNRKISSGLTYCAEHHCPNHACHGDFNCAIHTCRKYGCKNPKYKDYFYCRSHKCPSGGCGNTILGKGKWCSDHSCKACQRFVRDGQFCLDHRCEVSGCNLQAKDGDKFVYDYCEQHLCPRNKCEKRIFPGSVVCEDHICQSPDCFKANHKKSLYCMLHKCLECPNQRVSGTEGLCRDHLCCINDCLNRDAGLGMCKYHLSEAVNLLRKEKIIYKDAECCICYERNVEIRIDCGHTGCSKCLSKLKTCGLCQVPITEPQRIYLT